MIYILFMTLAIQIHCFSYQLSFTMRITIMASPGSNNESLVALENIVIRLNTDSDIELGQEPEVDIEDSKVKVLPLKLRLQEKLKVNISTDIVL